MIYVPKLTICVFECVQSELHKCILNVNLPYQDNNTPLNVASQEGHHDALGNLLGAVPDVNTATSDVSNDIFYGVMNLKTMCNLYLFIKSHKHPGA